MKKFVCIFIMVIAAVLSGCTKLDSLESRVDQVENDLNQGQQNQKDHVNLPNSIILETEKIENVNKGDTVDLSIIVNPSDFALTTEKLSLLESHHLYTEGDVFDNAAHCNLSIINLKQSDNYEGAYTVSVAIGGEGNFFDDISAYVLYGEKNQEGKIRYICSDSNIDITVIPSIKEAFCLEIPNQSFYTYKQDNWEITPEALKTQYFGMWLNLYKDKDGMSKAYDRSLISSIQLVGSDCIESCTLTSSTFLETGILKMDLKENSQYWTDAIKSYTQKGAVSVSYPEGSILRFSRLGKENADYPIDEAKLFFNAIYEKEKTVSLTELEQIDSITFDISKEMASAGLDDSFKNLRNCAIFKGDFTKESGTLPSCYTETHTLSIKFYSLVPIKKKKEDKAVVIRNYNYTSIQRPDGTFYTSPISQEPQKELLSFFVKYTIKLSD